MRLKVFIQNNWLLFEFNNINYQLVMKKFVELEVNGGMKVFNTDFIYKIEKVDDSRCRIFLNVPGENELRLQDYTVFVSYPNLISLFEVGKINKEGPKLSFI